MTSSLPKRIASATVAIVMLCITVAQATEPAPPYPPYPPPPPASRPVPPPPPRYYPPPPPVAPPPPLSPVMRAIYAPFYVAGLIVRYGVYYVVVAPFEVFGRALDYGVKGGVERPPPPPRGDQ